jgi:hypothetical protein
MRSKWARIGPKFTGEGDPKHWNETVIGGERYYFF